MSNYIDYPRSLGAIRLLNALAVLFGSIGLIAVGLGLWGIVISEASASEVAFVVLVAFACFHATLTFRKTAGTVQAALDIHERATHEQHLV